MIKTPEFFIMFWNSCKLVLPIIAGQVLIGAPAAWTLTKIPFRGQKLLQMIYIILMLLPFQVTMVSSYLTLDALSLIDTRLAVILPGVFSPFAVFIMTQGFRVVPTPLLEAAKLDGAGVFRCFLLIGVPLGFPGILSAVVLGFLEYWAAIEQPMIFLKNPALWPLSLFMPTLSGDGIGMGFVAAILILLPGVLVFLFGQHDLERGIVAAGLKE
jgi:multiple sugar transport system permease protein